MKRVLILGAGLVAKPIVQHLLSKQFFVTVASNTPDRAQEMTGSHPDSAVIFWEAEDNDTLSKLIAAHDLTVSLLPYVFHVMVAKICLRHRKNMVTTSYVKPEMHALDQDAKDAGLLFLNECGLDPGIDHMSAMRIIDHIHSKGGAVSEFYSICGALPAPEATDNPFRYKFSWSPKGVVMAGNNDALYLKDGKRVAVHTRDLFRDPFRVEYPEIGTLEVYPNRDSLAYQDIYGIPEARTVFRGTFRYPGWCEIIDALKRLDLISYEKKDLSGMTFADLIALQIGKKKSSLLKEDIAAYIGVLPASLPIEALEWLGMLEDVPMNRDVDTTFEVTSDQMISKMVLGPQERDMVVLQHTFLAANSDGRKEIIRSRMLDFGTLATNTSIARTVALPAAIAVEMILSEMITVKGVHIPVIPEIYNPILDNLEQMGIKMIEEYGLPLSENVR